MVYYMVYNCIVCSRLKICMIEQSICTQHYSLVLMHVVKGQLGCGHMYQQHVARTSVLHVVAVILLQARTTCL